MKACLAGTQAMEQRQLAAVIIPETGGKASQTGGRRLTSSNLISYLHRMTDFAP